MRLKRNISGPAASALTCFFQRSDLCMDDVVVKVSSLSDNVASGRHYHTANERIWADEADSRTCEIERTAAHSEVFVCTIVVCQVDLNASRYANKLFM
jgi:hypothetical protein